MNTLISGRRTLFFALFLAAALGCGDNSQAVREKHFAELAKYSPEALSSELINRLSSIKENAALYAAKGKADDSGEGRGNRVEKSKKDPFTADSVIEDIANKALKITDQPKADVYAAIIAAVDKSPLDAGTKDRVRTELKKAMGL